MLPAWYYVLSALLYGAAIGSFLNVCIYRIPRGMSVAFPPSSCPRCKSRIHFSDNLPVVSWLLLAGRCRACAAPISPRYPIVEAVNGAAYAVFTATLGVSVWLFVSCLLFSCSLSLVLAATDQQRQVLLR